MKLKNVLQEVWSKGHTTKNQLIRLLTSVFGDRAKITPIDRRGNSDGIEATVTMTYYDFIDKFSGAQGTMDRILQLSGSKKTHDPENLNHSKAQQLLDRVFAKANKNIRQFMPHGWLIAGVFHGNPLINTLNHEITFKIKRDIGVASPNQEKYFHATLYKNVKSILQHGLRPSTSTRNEYDSYRSRIFLSKSLDGLDMNFLIQLFDETRTNPTIAVLEITLSNDYKTYVDSLYSTEGVYVEETIPPERVKVIYEGKLSEIPWSV